MAKSSLILMLVWTQLLAGSGGSVYLCISDDGSHWCVDSDPATCTCCQHETEQDEGGECRCSRAGMSRDENESPRESPTLAGQPCGCTHILISNPEQSPTTLRVSSRTNAERLSQLVALLHHILPHDQFVVDGPHPALRHNSPPIPSQSLAILSSVVLRC